MKNLWSIITKTQYFHVNQYVVITLNKAYILLFTAAALTLLLVNACSSKEPVEAVADAKAALKQQNIADIEENIKNSYARLAAKRADVCPKLIQKNRHENTIERTAEVMVDEHCDYFLYPHAGQRITVSVNNDQIEALLIVPILHNFADGQYPVTSYDKHVIRLSYNGATYKPERLNYDVAISISD